MFELWTWLLQEANKYYQEFITYFWFYLPFGVIGMWRWGMWVLRKVAGMRYRPQAMQELGYSTSVITPVYNENPDVFRRALLSWLRDKPTEIIAVIDQSDKRCMVEFERFAQEHPEANLKMVITNVPGKRPALVTGMRAASGDIIFLVDSDTIWDANVLPICVTPFADSKVGGVTCRQSVYNPRGAAGKIFDINLDTRYFEEMRFLAVTGDAITCLSGRTAVYRRESVIPVLDGLLNETFRGKRVISGDDKCLTRLVQAEGWVIRYQETARVYTPAFSEIKVFMNQRLRWSRNSWRADLKMLASDWIWKREQFLALHLIDRLLQPITTLIGPALLLSLLARMQWWPALMLVAWWFGSRTIKIFPSLRRDPSYVLLLPAYLYFTYFFAVVRIFAFFTMNQQGWITRWDKNRMQGSSLWRLMSSYGATVATILFIFGAVQLMHFRQASAIERANAVSLPGQLIVVNAPADEVSGAMEQELAPKTNPAQLNETAPTPVSNMPGPLPLLNATLSGVLPSANLGPSVFLPLVYANVPQELPRVSRLDASVLKMALGPWKQQPVMILRLRPGEMDQQLMAQIANRQMGSAIASSN